MTPADPSPSRPAPPAPPPSVAGYQPPTVHGPRVRTDVVDLYVFRPATRADERSRPQETDDQSPPRSTRVMFLQLLRATSPLKNTWHPAMGHIEAGESAVDCAVREAREEMGLAIPSKDVQGFWALEQVHPFYIAPIDTIVMSPRFAVEVSPAWQPTLDDENADSRWVHQDDAPTMFMWPGQREAIREILTSIVPERSPARQWLRIAHTR